MKKFIYSCFLLIIISSCSKDEGNSAPNVVSNLIYPTNKLLCSTNIIKFEWEGVTDSNGDTVSYVIEISKDDSFNTILESAMVESNFETFTLESGTTYYWRVKAVDNNGLESAYSSTYQFSTEEGGVENHLPSLPQLVAPHMNTFVSGTSTNLEWDATDADDDTLSYDIYFDTVNPPVTKIGIDQAEKTISANINAGTTYYWKVVAKDGNGGEAIGQVWSFSVN